MEILGGKNIKKLTLASAMVLVGSGGMANAAGSQDLQQQINDLRSQVEKEAGKLSINGFISAGVAGSDVPQSTRTTNINEDISFVSDSVVGVQLDFNMAEDTKATLQLVGRGLENFNTSVEWAYLSHSFSDNFSMKAGRLRIPTYTTSEYIEVGMAYPWVRPAPEVYDLVFFTYYDGAAFTYDFSMGSVDSSFQLLTGNASGLDSNNSAIGDIDFEIDAKLGLTYVASMGDWRLNLGYFKAEIIAEEGLGPELDLLIGVILPIAGVEDAEFNEVELDYINAGLSYDNGTWLVQAEGALIDSDNLFIKNEAFYVSVARRFGRWMPYLMYAQMENVNNDKVAEAAQAVVANAATIDFILAAPGTAALAAGALQANFQEAQKSSYLGASYDFLPNVKLKAEWRYVEPQDDTKGTFDAEEFFAEPFEHANVYSLVLDAVF